MAWTSLRVKGFFFIVPCGKQGFGFNEFGVGEKEQEVAFLGGEFESKEGGYPVVSGGIFDIAPASVGLIFGKDDTIEAHLFGAQQDLFWIKGSCL